METLPAVTERLSNEQIGRYPKYYRTVAGVTAAEAAAVIGKTVPQTIYSVESGAHRIEGEAMYTLLDLYAVDYDRAFTENLDESIEQAAIARKPATARLNKIAEIYNSLPEYEQKVLYSVARWAKAYATERLEGQGCENGRGCSEEYSASSEQ